MNKKRVSIKLLPLTLGGSLLTYLYVVFVFWDITSDWDIFYQGAGKSAVLNSLIGHPALVSVIKLFFWFYILRIRRNSFLLIYPQFYSQPVKVVLLVHP